MPCDNSPGSGDNRDGDGIEVTGKVSPRPSARCGVAYDCCCRDWLRCCTNAARRGLFEVDIAIYLDAIFVSREGPFELQRRGRRLRADFYLDDERL